MQIVGIRPVITLLCVLGLGIAVGRRATAAVPPAPTPLAPANGAPVTVPFPISWFAVTDPNNGPVAYNWQVSPSSSFTAISLQNSTNGLTQDTVSGLPNGTYFWRVQAFFSSTFTQGAWSQFQSFTITGAGAGEPGTPTLAPTQAYSTFHPFETETFNWTAVPGAASYVLQYSTDPSFPIVTRGQFDNIPNTTMTFAIGNPEGVYSARVYAVNASGIAGVPSNVITFSVFFNNPIGPPPALVSPASGTVATLPVTLTWADVPNPQPSGYELQIARDAGFTSIEEDDPQLNGPSRTVLSLTAGTKFWRVRSAQGDNSPTTAAETAWSAARSFTIPSAPPTPVSVTVISNPLYSGDTTWVAVQLTSAAPASGATIALSSSNSSAAPVPATVAMPANLAWTQFQITTGQVASPTVVTLTATLNARSASVQFTLMPPSLKSLTMAPGTISGGAQPQAIVMLNGQAPAGGAVISLSSNSPAMQPPAVANIAPGSPSASLPIPTSTVTANTIATLTATWNGVSAQSPVTLTPQQPPTALTLSPTSTVGQSGGSFATVSIASPALTDNTLQVTVDNPTVATMVPTGVQIPMGSTRGGFNIFTTPVTTTTLVTISVSGGGVTQSAILTVTPSAPPPPPAALSSLTVTPASVTGGAGSQGTLTLTGAAPAGGFTATLSSNNPAAAMPASVTVAQGATSTTFAISTSSVATSTPVTITASAGGLTRTATLTVTPPAQAATLTVTATGRSGERVTSSPAGINVAVGSSMTASFGAGKSITLTVSNGRKAAWSGACTNGGSKTCTFTLTGNATVTANVQ